MKENNI